MLGDRVTWDRGDLPDGEGTIVDLTPDEARRLPGLPEGWVRVRDDRNNLFMFPETQLKTG